GSAAYDRGDRRRAGAHDARGRSRAGALPARAWHGRGIDARLRGARRTGGRSMMAFVALREALESARSAGDQDAALASFLQAASDEDAAWALYLLSGRRLPRAIAPEELRGVATEATGLPGW